RLFPNDANGDVPMESLTQINKSAIIPFVRDVESALKPHFPSDDERWNFVSTAMQSFLYNDVQQAKKLLFAMSAKGSTFGLLVDSTLNSQKKVISASVQPMSIGHDPIQERVVYGSEFNSTKSGLVNYDHPKTRVLTLEQGGENGREIATVEASGDVHI